MKQQDQISLKNKTQKSTNKQILITYSELGIFLDSLQENQANQLKNLIDSHAYIDSYPKQGYFTGELSIMQEIKYLIHANTREVTYLNSNEESSIYKQQIKQQTIYCRSFSFKAQNMKRVLKQVVSINAVASNRLQFCYNPQREQIFSNKNTNNEQIRISNRSIDDKRIYIIFQQYYEMIELQSLLQIKVHISNIGKMIQRFQENPQNPIIFQKIQQKQIYYCHLREKEYLKNKFISHMNKKFNNALDVIIIKAKLLQLVLVNKIYFNNSIKIILDQDQIMFGIKDVSQIKIYQNTFQSSNYLQNLATSLLEKAQSHCVFKDYLIDVVSCFNIFLLLERGVKTMFFIQSQQNSKKKYIYFTFYKKFMEVQQVDGRINLIKRQISEQITNKPYKIALQKILKFSALNQLPFIMIPQDASCVNQKKIQDFQNINTGDITKLFAYRYLLDIKKYKLVTNNEDDQNIIKDTYEEPFKITVDKKSALYLKIGALKGPQIIKKERVKQNDKYTSGYILVNSSYASLFIDKYLNELSPQK